MSTAFENCTREEVIAAFRESLRRKHEWEEEAEKTIQRIQKERQQLNI